MADRVNCVRCGTSILGATARRNQGMCAQCAKAPEGSAGEFAKKSPLGGLGTAGDDLRAKAILSLVVAVAFAVVGVIAFLWFRGLESEGGQIRTHALIILAYRTLGSGGVLGLFLVGAAAWVVNAIVKFVKAARLPDSDR